MTRVDYNLIAAAITKADDCLDMCDGWSLRRQGIEMVARELADAFATKNPRFDRIRFLKACGF